MIVLVVVIMIRLALFITIGHFVRESGLTTNGGLLRFLDSSGARYDLHLHRVSHKSLLELAPVMDHLDKTLFLTLGNLEF